MLAVPYCMC